MRSLKNFLKRTLALTAAAVCLCSTACSGKENGKDAKVNDVKKDMTAAEYAKDMGIGINLGNTMEAYKADGCEQITYEWIPKAGTSPTDYEKCWGAVETTQEVIDGMKAAGFNTVRIPVFWGNMMENDGSWTINKDYMKRVQEIVDYCMKADVYAVVNIHHFDEFIIRRHTTEECEEIFSNLWTQIAENFKDYSYKLVFEGYNEYLGGSRFDENGELKDLPESEGFDLTNRLNQTFVDAVRKTGGNNAQRLLIVSGYNTNIDRTTKPDFKMPSDSAEDKLMVSVHYIDNMCYWTNNIGGQDWLDYSKDQCELLKAAFTDKGIPVFVGECSAKYESERMASDAGGKTSAECLSTIMTMCADYGFVPVIWDTNDNMYSRTEMKIKDDSEQQVVTETAKKIKNK